MSEPENSVREPRAEKAGAAPSVPKLGFALVFGLAFGFLLQKGGVGKFHILIGQLLLQDFTVAKVMLTAILVGMPGIFLLHRKAKVNLHIKPTRLAANVLGGLVFGAGFALLGYCPGTAAVALGQGNWDAVLGMLGLLLGSYLYAEFSAGIKGSVEKWGDKGKLLLPDLLHMPRTVFVPVFMGVLVVGLIVLDRLALR
jgi:uncharacterized protein